MPNIRRATIADIPAIAPIFADFQRTQSSRPDVFDTTPLTTAKIAEIIGSEDEEFYVLTSESGEAIGLIVFSLMPYRSHSALFLSHICVLSAHRGQGHGKALIEFLSSYAREKNCTHVELCVGHFNPTARKFYAHLGFAEISCVMEYILLEEQLAKPNNVRLATPSDLAGILAVATSLDAPEGEYPNALNRPYFRKEDVLKSIIENQKQQNAVVATNQSGEIVAYMVIQVEETTNVRFRVDAKYAAVCFACLLPTADIGKVADALFDYARHYAATGGCPRMEIDLLSSNTMAREFLRNRGMTECYYLMRLK
ncbi:MAG: GNAT family N-acetyltransferase [Oscillospiraceae bacterium]|nr:GNAT family N-acetyltransferase [Oscillospiraceae bacterium]